jgi:diguanylate cyclase (GGDEF)-like protein
MAKASSSQSADGGRPAGLAALRSQIDALDRDIVGLMNRRAFMDSLNALCANDSTFAVAFLDLDRFKPLNDQFGHAAGDAVLRELSNRLQQVAGVRAAARLGGDELAVALDPCLSGAELDQTIASLHAGLTRQVEWEGKALSVGVSIGYATSVRDAQSLPTLLKAADTAMRRAKAHQSGWASFSAELDGAALDTHSPEIEFRLALARGDLRCIGATTPEDYRRPIEKDPALDRRFQQVVIREPDRDTCLQILRGLRERYELHHGVPITDGALVAATRLADRYIADRSLPDSAIDLVDEAAAQLKMEVTSKPRVVEEAEAELRRVELALRAAETAPLEERLERQRHSSSRRSRDSVRRPGRSYFSFHRSVAGCSQTCPGLSPASRPSSPRCRGTRSTPSRSGIRNSSPPTSPVRSPQPEPCPVWPCMPECLPSICRPARLA